jgi:hypothetical protein
LSDTKEYSSPALIKAIQDGVQTAAIGITDEAPFFTRPVFNPPEPERHPQASALVIHTLDGVISYLKNDSKLDVVVPREDTDSGIAVHVLSESEVRVIGALEGYHRQRENLVIAKSEAVLGTTFQFGQFYPNENFIIALQSLFVRTDARDGVLSVVGRITDSVVHEFADDGITQTVEAKTGVTTVKHVDVPNPVTLQPYRTFREIDQPASDFILRVKQGDGGPPKCALFESDGGRWKLDSIARIRVYLAQELEGLDIPIIA